MNIMSLFDGISCGHIALDRAGIPVDNYYASDIDKYAISITQKHFPNTIQLGDVTQIDFTQFIGKIDLLIGGSPCQDLSIAGKKEGLQGERSRLFFDYIRALKTIKPKYFLLENNASMSKENRYIMTSYMGVEPVEINSCHFSAQSRKRLYWTNIPIAEIPTCNLTINDILEKDIDDKYYMNVPIILKDKYKTSDINQIGDIPKEVINDNERQRRVYSVDGKSPTILARSDSPKILCIGQIDIKASQQVKRVYSINGLSPTVDTMQGGHRQIKVLQNQRVRKLTPLECERLQTLPDNYTEGISNTQRYKCIGNGWTVDVIAHIFKGLKDE